MKTYQKLASITVVAWVVSQGPVAVLAEPPANESLTESTPAPPAADRHLALCAMLGLKVGKAYEFLISGNETVHYWQIRSLGADGWILAKDSLHAATWVNLSQVIAVTPININPTVERPKKPNR